MNGISTVLVLLLLYFIYINYLSDQNEIIIVPGPIEADILPLQEQPVIVAEKILTHDDDSGVEQSLFEGYYRNSDPIPNGIESINVVM